MLPPVLKISFLHAFRDMEEIDDEIIDFLPVFDRLFPFGGDGRQAIIGSGDLPVDSADHGP